jgi:hypothetical protein
MNILGSFPSYDLNEYKKFFKEESNGEIKISSSEIIMMSFQQ